MLSLVASRSASVALLCKMFPAQESELFRLQWENLRNLPPPQCYTRFSLCRDGGSHLVRNAKDSRWVLEWTVTWNLAEVGEGPPRGGAEALPERAVLRGIAATAAHKLGFGRKPT